MFEYNIYGFDEQYHKTPDDVTYVLKKLDGNVEWHEPDQTIQLCIAPTNAKRILLRAGRGITLLESLEVYQNENKQVLLGKLKCNEEELVVYGPSCFVVAKLGQTVTPYMIHMLVYETQ
jgi:hypothetical protein